MPSVVVKHGADTKLQSDWPSTPAAEAEVARLVEEGASLGNWQYNGVTEVWYSETLNLTIRIVD